MPLRYGWKGYLKLSLVSVPVRSFSAVSATEGEIHFHQLHSQCHSRIKYVKTCPLHGPVPANEIVSGYEYAKGQYVVMEEGELDRLKGESDKSVNVEAIVPATAIDSLYLTERSSYLIPDGAVGQKPYALISKCLGDRNVVAIGRLIRNGKDEVVIIRPSQGLLVMTALSSAAQVRTPEAFLGELSKTSVSAAELKLTNALFDAFQQDEIDLSAFKDHYTERVSELIEAKVKGNEITTGVATSEPEVINLMDALKKSVASAQSRHGRKETAEVRRNIVKASQAKAATKRKSKTA